MDATRHPFTKELISIPAPADESLRSAEALEKSGNWYMAGEEYRHAAELGGGTGAGNQARMLARAATCFEIAAQSRGAARAYFEAGSVLRNNGMQLQVAGELFNRAALHFRNVGEYFNAGDSWRRAGEAFSQAPNAMISTSDNIPPVPGSAGKFTIAGYCYTAGGDSFLLAGDNAMWSCMAYWEAGTAHSAQGHGYHAFVAYRKALVAAIRFYGTHGRDELRRCLPLTDQERAAKLDPLSVMEDAAFRGNAEQGQLNARLLGPGWARIATERQIAAAYHEFYLAFAAIGNGREAGTYRAAEKERSRRLLLAERRYGKACLYWLWSKTSGYGESLGRWALVCGTVISGFSAVYAAFKLVEPVTHWVDYFYFSVVTFTSLGYGDIHPVGVAGKLVACMEIISGLVLFGLLLTFVGNRFQRA